MRGAGHYSWVVEHEKIRLRAAQVDDIPLLTHWDEQPHVIESDPNDDWNWESGLARDPEWREQLVAEADGVSHRIRTNHRSRPGGQSLLGRVSPRTSAR
jgi:hypothetical protein